MTIAVVENKVAQRQIKDLFLKHYEDIGTVWEACKKCGIKSRSTPYLWANNDDEFKRRMHEVQSNIEDRLAQSLIDAGSGVKSLSQPQVTSAIFMLKALNPRKYAEKFQTALSTMNVKEIEIKTVEVRVRGD